MSPEQGRMSESTRDPTRRLIRATGLFLAGLVALLVFVVIGLGSWPVAAGLAVGGFPSVAGYWLYRAAKRRDRLTLREAARARPAFAGLLAGFVGGTIGMLIPDDPVAAYYGWWIDVGGAVLAVAAVVLLLLHSHYPGLESVRVAVFEGLICVGAVLFGILSAANGTESNDWAGVGLTAVIAVGAIAAILYERSLRKREVHLVVRVDEKLLQRLGGPGPAAARAKELLIESQGRQAVPRA